MPTRSKASRSAQRLTRLGAPEAGSASALALAGGDTLFVGSPVGIHRARVGGGQAPSAWERLSEAPIGILSLAVSPDYASDQTLLAGTNTGIYVSRDGGETWAIAPMPMTVSSVPVICFSPNYTADGIVLAGTLEDGVVFSDNRGESWLSRSFGLLDPAIYAVGFSPNFASDRTVYAATDTALYFSYNEGLAWKDFNFPETAAPALSLVVASVEDAPVFFAGTETEGLYRASGHGGAWEKLSLPAACVNGLHWSTDQGLLLAATEAGVYRSADRGDTWTLWLDQPNVISVAADAALAVAGSVEQGLWLAEGQGEWQRVAGLSTRAFIGLALSPAFDQDRTAYLYGPQERVWQTVDGGHAWRELQADLPMLEFRSVAVAPDFALSRGLAAATDAGVLVSVDAAQTWNRTLKEPAGLVAFSPNGKFLAASLLKVGLGLTDDRGETWRRVPGPWDFGGRILALAVTNAGHFHVALLEGVGASVSFYQGRPGEFEKVITAPIGRNPLVSIFVPSESVSDRPWYAGFGHEVHRFSARKGRPSAPASVFSPDEPAETLILLTGLQDQVGQLLIAGTGRRLFTSTDAKDWTDAYNFGTERAVSLALSPAFSQDKTVYALLVGGSVCQLLMS